MRVCDVEGCGGIHKGNGFCARHFQEDKRRERGVPLRKERGICSVDWCGSPCHAKGLCSNHYQIRNRNGDESVYHRARNGFGTQGPGVRLISTEFGQEYEHIVVCRNIYGPLEDSATIHHIDGNQHNNGIGNLLVCDGQGQHMRCHWWQSLLSLGREPVFEIDVSTATPVLHHPEIFFERKGMLYAKCGSYVEVSALPDSYGFLTLLETL